jgi:hypothetical protein
MRLQLPRRIVEPGQLRVDRETAFLAGQTLRKTARVVGLALDRL